MAAEIVAAGGVLWRRGPDARPEVAVVHRPKYDDWTLPKGKVDPGESLPAAARREIAEETGFRSVLGRPLGQVGYRVEVKSCSTKTAYKTVDYFTARAIDGEFQPGAEVDELRWCGVADADKLLTYKRDRKVLGWFAADPEPVATVLLVRHAKAGKREEWPGADEQRPLTPAGAEQAEHVRELLPHFGVDRVYSAPLVRCRQTVQKAADDLGVPVVDEPLLSEEGYWPDENAGLNRLLHIAADGGTPAICSQGGVIPDVVSTLADSSGVRLATISSKKGSVWVLSFTQNGSKELPSLFAAHYLPTPDYQPQPHEW